MQDQERPNEEAETQIKEQVDQVSAETQEANQPEQHEMEEDGETKEQVRRRMRELGYLNTKNIIAPEQELAIENQESAVVLPSRGDRLDRAERVGGLNYYKNRNDRLELAGLRKKHGHLINMAGDLNEVSHKRQKTNAKDFVESDLFKRLMGEKRLSLAAKNLDSINLPEQLEYMYPNKVQVFDLMRQLEQQMNEFISQKLLRIKEDL